MQQILGYGKKNFDLNEIIGSKTEPQTQIHIPSLANYD